MIGIYKITSPSNRVYIGQSIDIERRFRNYKSLFNCKSQAKLYRSFLKYGTINHVFEVIEECDIKDLLSKERFYQDLFCVIGVNGLNLILTSCADWSGKHSEESKLKMKLSSVGKNLGIKRSAETNLKNSIAKTGTKASDETKLKMSLMRKGKKLKKSTHKRKPMSEETIMKIKKSNIGKQSKGKHARAKKVIDNKTGIIYLCAIEAAESLGIKYNSLNKYLNGKTKNKTTLKYLY